MELHYFNKAVAIYCFAAKHVVCVIQSPFMRTHKNGHPKLIVLQTWATWLGWPYYLASRFMVLKRSLVNQKMQNPKMQTAKMRNPKMRWRSKINGRTKKCWKE